MRRGMDCFPGATDSARSASRQPPPTRSASEDCTQTRSASEDRTSPRRAGLPASRGGTPARWRSGPRRRFGSGWARGIGCRVLLALATALAVGSAHAAEDDVRARLERLPQPWKEDVHRVTRPEYETTLRYWAEKHAGLLSVEQAGASTEGMGIYLLAITDQSVPAADKQVALVSCLHGGPERSGTSTALHLVEWLLGDSPEAAETRRKQIVLVMPIVNPQAYFETDRFGNAQGIDPYSGGGAANWDLATMTYKLLDEAPEIAAYLEVVDRYRPEVICDLHGIGLQEYAPDRLGDRRMYRGQTMFESTGSSYSNHTLRPWDWRVLEAMVAAGREAGYPSDRIEADAQQTVWGHAIRPLSGKLWRGRPNFYTAQYAYARYHTMVSVMEIGWEASGVARLQGLLRIGNGTWPGEGVPGYPVNRVDAFYGHFVTGYGRTAEERRRSRVELWSRQEHFHHAMLYPQTDGRESFVVAVTDEAAKLLDADKGEFLENLEGRAGFNVDAIRAFVEVGPEDKLSVARGAAPPAAGVPPIERGLGLRVRLPYRELELVDLRLNGRPVAESPADGYRRWVANGFTQVQINVPPEAAKATGLFVVTCAYVPGEKRSYGWTPPREVLERIR